jgi:hypothetical protein
MPQSSESNFLLGLMRLKDFPAQKLDLIAARPAGQLREFLSSIPQRERAHVLVSVQGGQPPG